MADSFSVADRAFMAQAIQVAKQGLYSCHPNPRVGCLLVDAQGNEIARGAHLVAGQGHAEVNALAIAKERAEGATAYVTLEPCSHTGKTGPCAVALVKAGVKRVVAAMVDPNPEVAGRGLAILAEHGIEVSSGLLEDEAKALNPGFIKRMLTGTPYVRLKTASSLDGRTAMASGESFWITGLAARSDVQQWRARSSAIITGVDSVIQDDSALTVRPEQLPESMQSRYTGLQPLRVVLDSQLRLPLGAKLLSLPGQTLVVTCLPEGERHQALREQGAEVLVLESNEAGQVPLTALLEHLASAYQCNEVLVETGATLAGSFLKAGLVDEWLLYQATCLLGSSARPLVQWPLETMAQKQSFGLVDIRQLGNDLRLQLKPQPSE
ncbi:MAG: bifunctional diaminohydroxyphosphoribosylaminopyrimidine deaminase/5-amino-6-(5-phosphoribosylamino)uracil reductase RibD [Pontibacterium sp.]